MTMFRRGLALASLAAFAAPTALAQPELLFGQVAIGGQGDLVIQSVISVTNSGSVTYQGTFFFFTGEGTPWNPMVEGAEISNGQHEISIPPLTTMSLTLSGTDIQAGSAVLRGTGPPETALDGNLTYFFVTGGTLSDSIGVGPSAEIYLSTVPFQDFSTIALALANQDPTPKEVELTLRRPDGAVHQTETVPLPGNAHDARFLDQIFGGVAAAGESLTGGRVDIKSSQPIFGTAVTFTGGQISSLPLPPARVEYDFEATDSETEEVAATGKVILWAEGKRASGLLQVRTEGGVPVENPDLTPIGGELDSGNLLVSFVLGAFQATDFSFDQEEVVAELVFVELEPVEITDGTIRLTRVAGP